MGRKIYWAAAFGSFAVGAASGLRFFLPLSLVFFALGFIRPARGSGNPSDGGDGIGTEHFGKDPGDASDPGGGSDSGSEGGGDGGGD